MLEKVVGMREDYRYLCDWKLFFDFLMISYKENKLLGMITNIDYIYYRFYNNNISNNLIFNHFFEHKYFIKKYQKSMKRKIF